MAAPIGQERPMSLSAPVEPSGQHGAKQRRLAWAILGGDARPEGSRGNLREIPGVIGVMNAAVPVKNDPGARVPLSRRCRRGRPTRWRDGRGGDIVLVGSSGCVLGVPGRRAGAQGGEHG
jgi:hypothetical protein